ncbi:AAA family ATPase [Burkholderia plantarii]|uniref:AAA family ATPase n=1 Tax=Burkholderia plantarii TaxID=41899 RepID=UPI000706C5B5|nr:AAA family ATPase [Burkholderia plantarii]ALK31827.1 Superfamily I DNA and RNA helicase [Burkholderia plantarii]GLZ21963.1 hypothetical protein Bpla01_54920 [Burkholderia plantarii]
MRLPSFSALIEEQRQVFMADPDQSILVVGPPGSGKTSVALWKANILAGPDYQRRVTVVTKNRLLAALATQISQDQGNAPVTSTTMHTLVWNHYRNIFGHNIPQHLPYQFNWQQALQDYAEANVTPSIDHLIVDEGQNLPKEFFIWACRFGAVTVSVFADENQSTEDGGCHVADLRDAGFTEMHVLTVNHRNTFEIAELIECFHQDRYVPPAPAQRGRSNEPPRMITVATWEALAQQVAVRFGNRGGSIGVIVYRQEDINVLHALLRARLPDARVDMYTSNAEAKAEDAIRLRDAGITIISGESAIGLEFDTVYLQDLDRSLPMILPVHQRRLYMLCARARDALLLVNGPNLLSEAQLACLPPPPILER